MEYPKGWGLLIGNYAIQQLANGNWPNMPGEDIKGSK
jgi:hypothetical protein